MNTKTLFIAGIALVSLAAASQQGVLLRRELKEDATDKYSLKSEVKMVADVPSMGEMDYNATSTMAVTMKSGKLDTASGQMGVDATIGNFETKSSGSAAQVIDGMLDNMPKEFKLTGKLDARNRLNLDKTKSPDFMMMMFTGTSPSSSLVFVEFPEKNVNVGDTWSYPAPKSPIFAKDQTMTAKLVGEKDFEGAKVWAISISGKLNVDADVAKIIKESGTEPQGLPDSMQMTGTSDVTGEALVDKATGKTVQYTATMTNKGKMDMGAMGTIPSNGTVNLTLKLQK